METVVRRCFQNRCSEKFRNIHRKTTVLKSLFNKVAGIAGKCFPVNIAKCLRTAFFIEHLWWLLLDLAISTFNALMQNTAKWSDTLTESHDKWCKIVNVRLNILRHYVLCIIRLCSDVRIGFILLSLSWRRSLLYRNLSGFYMIRTCIMS